MSEINTSEFPGQIVRAPIAASTKIEAGNLIAINGSGYAVHASDAASRTVIGRAEETVDNSAGSAGDLSVTIKRGAFCFANDATQAVTIAHVGKKIYVKDSATVQSATGTNSVVAGLCLGFENGEVIVDTTLASAL